MSASGVSNIEGFSIDFSATELSPPSWDRQTKRSHFEIYAANRKEGSADEW
jgi:hypothetical protein